MCNVKVLFGVAVFLKGLLYVATGTLGFFANHDLHIMIASGVLIIVSIVQLATACFKHPGSIAFGAMLLSLETLLLTAALGFLIYCIIDLPSWWKGWIDDEFTELWDVDYLTNHQDITIYLAAVVLALLLLALFSLITAIASFIQARRHLRRTLPIQIAAEFAQMPYTTLDVEGPEVVKLYNVKL
ncbi:unnamed protein product [Bursaphelenchus okinawaensis]|uniref:Uncharacterized protein n=1 Tax=Bursaphelenchus okinawaensis TaxID=465554 RepID=A0A811LGV2_9BILA|nr:unnamed protein product [Bursaphelenchus okinawaensis]CAG9123561.1 unnamed protein product [Bursaphelenchus okinawaensis]